MHGSFRRFALAIYAYPCCHEYSFKFMLIRSQTTTGVHYGNGRRKVHALMQPDTNGGLLLPWTLQTRGDSLLTCSQTPTGVYNGNGLRKVRAYMQPDTNGSLLWQWASQSSRLYADRHQLESTTAMDAATFMLVRSQTPTGVYYGNGRLKAHA